MIKMQEPFMALLDTCKQSFPKSSAADLARRGTASAARAARRARGQRQAAR